MADRVLAPRDVLSLVRDAHPSGFVRAAVFDADGTLWRGDIGDTAFAACVRAGLVSDATFAGPLQAWANDVGLVLPADKERAIAAIIEAAESGALAALFAARGLDGDAWRRSLYEMQAWIYADQPHAKLEAFAAALFADGFAAQIFETMRALVDELEAAGIAVHIASASHLTLVRAGARHLNLPAARILGMDPTPCTADPARPVRTLRTSTYGPDKAGAVQALLGGSPLAAFGDSVLFTDKQLLDSAHLPFAVATRGAHRAAALAHPRMILVDP